MIKANELRIGNWVGHHDEDYTDDENEIHFTGKVLELRERTALITGAGEGGTSCAYNELIPIPLTQEILYKSGFVKKTQDPKRCEYKMFWVEFNGSGGWQFVIQWDDPEFITIAECFYYVHELQNLFFGVCRNELEIKI